MKVSVAEAEITEGRVVMLMQDTDAHYLQAFFVVIRKDHETVWSAISRQEIAGGGLDLGSIDDALPAFSEIVRESVLESLCERRDR